MPANYSHCRGLPQFVYVMGSWSSGAVKIGITADLEGRRGALQAGYPRPLEILWFTAGGRALEMQLHARLADYRTVSEWFEFGDARTALSAVVAATLQALSGPAGEEVRSESKPIVVPPENRVEAEKTLDGIAACMQIVFPALVKFSSGATVSRIARTAHCSQDTARRQLHELERRGLAQVVPERGWWIATANLATAGNKVSS